MKTIIKSLAIILFLAPSVSSHAQDFVKRGTTELGGSVLFMAQWETSESAFGSNSSQTIFYLNPYIGFMSSGGFEIGFIPGIQTVSQGNSKATVLNLLLAPAYNFYKPNSKIYPCLEFLIGYNSIGSGSSGSNAWEGLAIGFDAGLKINIGGNSLLLIQLQYLSQEFSREGTSSGYPLTSTHKLSSFSLGMGFRVFLSRKEPKK